MELCHANSRTQPDPAVGRLTEGLQDEPSKFGPGRHFGNSEHLMLLLTGDAARRGNPLESSWNSTPKWRGQPGLLCCDLVQDKEM